MPGLFGRSKRTASNPLATPSQDSSGDRPKQERRHSDNVRSKPSHRPNLFSRSKTWHSTGSESSPKRPKSPKQNGSVRSFFGKSKKSSDDEDDEDDEIWCKGGKTGMLVGDEDSPSRANTSRQTDSVNAPGAVPSRSHPKAGQLQRKVSTRGARSMTKPKMPSSRSASKDSSTSRTTTSSLSSSTNLKSPYTNSSAASSFLHPRSINSVYSQRDRVENSGAVSDPEDYCRGRDYRNSRRKGARNAEVSYSSDDGINFSSRDYNGKTKASHLPPKAFADNVNNPKHRHNETQKKPSRHRNKDVNDGYDESDYDLHHRYKPPSTGERNPIPLARTRAVTKERGGRDGHLPRAPFNGHNSHSYEQYQYGTGYKPLNHHDEYERARYV